jgi:signal transduction histidine kinase
MTKKYQLSFRIPSFSDPASGQIFSFPLLRSIRQFEWIAILIFLCIDCSHRYAVQLAGQDPWPSFAPFMIGLAVLSVLQAYDISQWRVAKCLSWLILQIIVATITSILGTCGPLLFFNLLITAKSMLLLGLRGAAIIVMANLAGLGFFLFATRASERRGVELMMACTEIALQLVLFAMVNLIIVLIARALVREAETRLRVQQLAKENETLTKELERNRIARDLHDMLGHTLVSLGLQIEQIEAFQARDAEKSRKALETARQLTVHLITEVRRTVQAIRDPTFNLDQSLQELIRQVKLNDQFSVELNVEVNQLPSLVGHEIFYIARECLTNVQKHALATTVTVRVEQKPHHVELSIIDDGKGFIRSSVASGFGLSNIEERVRTLAGKLSLDSSPDRGTQIVVSIPV